MLGAKLLVKAPVKVEASALHQCLIMPVSVPLGNNAQYLLFPPPPDGNMPVVHLRVTQTIIEWLGANLT